MSYCKKINGNEPGYCKEFDAYFDLRNESDSNIEKAIEFLKRAPRELPNCHYFMKKLAEIIENKNGGV